MLNATIAVAEFQGLSPELQSHYKQQEGGAYLLSVGAGGGFELSDVQGLKTALQNERHRADQAEAAVKEMKNAFDGLDPKVARDALEKVKEMDGWDPDKKLAEHKQAFENDLRKTFGDEKTQLLQKHQTEIEEMKGSSKSLTTQLEKVLLTSEAVKAIAGSGGFAELLLPIVQKYTRIVRDKEGDFRVEVVGEDGVPQISKKSGSTEPMNILELVEELRKDKRYAPAFSASGASGSGGTTAPGQTSLPGHKIRAADLGDFSKYKAAKRAAEKAGVGIEIVE